jgi:2-iminobutanoate/2-iminopropanoate deaminase
LKKEVRSNSAPTPIGPYSQAIDAGAVYCAGQIGVDPTTGELEQGIEAQTKRCLSNLEGVLGAAGLGLKDVVKTTVFLVDLADYKQMNDEYAKHFSAPFPARSTVQAAALPRSALVEIDAIGVR